MNKYPSYWQIYLNTNVIRKFENVLNYGKVNFDNRITNSLIFKIDVHLEGNICNKNGSTFSFQGNAFIC